MPDFLQHYWPLLLIAAWYAYKWVRVKQVRALIPQLRAQGALFVDVRTVAEFNAGNAPDCINIPLSDLRGRLQEIPADAPVVLCCASGTRSGMAATLLRRAGRRPIYNAGGWRNLL